MDETEILTILQDFQLLDVEIRDYVVNMLLVDDDVDVETLQEFFVQSDDALRLLGRIKQRKNGVTASVRVQAHREENQEKLTMFSHQVTMSQQLQGSAEEVKCVELTDGKEATDDWPQEVPFRPRKSMSSQRKTKPTHRTGNTLVELEQPVDDEQPWCGRGRGGRGNYSAKSNSVANLHVHLPSLNLLDGMTPFLLDTVFQLSQTRRYGLLGRNGVGKSTLLYRLANHQIRGLPKHLRIAYCQQHHYLDKTNTRTPLEELIHSDVEHTSLLEQQQILEDKLESVTCDNVEATAAQLGEIAVALETTDPTARAVEILQGLQFTRSMMESPVIHLSGGWRMRLALAQTLIQTDCSDLLLLDECTNHLDLHGLAWLTSYLQNCSVTVLVVSHDVTFLDAVCTDTIVLEHEQLHYHVGNYSAYETQQSEKASREAQILDAAERQRAKAQAFCQKQSKKTADPNRQRQAKMIREKKMDRIGNYRTDGKRYKLLSLKKLDKKSMRLPEKVHIEQDEPVINMHFPDPSWPSGEVFVRLEDYSFGFSEHQTVLNKLTLHLGKGSKTALVGSNGAGKTTLMKVVSGQQPNDVCTSGNLWVHPSLRVGHLAQHAVEELVERFADVTVLEYVEQQLFDKSAVEAVTSKASGNLRQYLGAFGLGGRHAHRAIGQLSGGERMRLCFATVLADEPHLLLLDETTNHMDIETLESLSAALNEFQGAVLMVSHNQGFLRGFCNELWVLEHGRVTVNYSDTFTFDEIFSDYRNSVVAGGTVLGDRRRRKANMAKRATKQRAGIQGPTTLL